MKEGREAEIKNYSTANKSTLLCVLPLFLPQIRKFFFATRKIYWTAKPLLCSKKMYFIVERAWRKPSDTTKSGAQVGETAFGPRSVRPSSSPAVTSEASLSGGGHLNDTDPCASALWIHGMTKHEPDPDCGRQIGRTPKLTVARVRQEALGCFRKANLWNCSPANSKSSWLPPKTGWITNKSNL